MKNIIFVFFLIGLSSCESAPMSLQVGSATCGSTNKSGLCKISWNLLDTPRTYYRVQRWSIEDNTWRNAHHVAITALGTQPNPVAGGALYRVLACNDLDATQDCIGTTVFWAPVIPKTAEDAAKIPDRVVVHDPENDTDRTFWIQKDLDVDTQIIIHNVYLVVKAFTYADFSELPAMTEPTPITIANTHTITLEEVIHLNVYPNYMGPREQQLGSEATRL